MRFKTFFLISNLNHFIPFKSDILNAFWFVVVFCSLYLCVLFLDSSLLMHVCPKVVCIRTEQKKNNLRYTNTSITPLNFCFRRADWLTNIVTIFYWHIFIYIHIFGHYNKIKWFLVCMYTSGLFSKSLTDQKAWVLTWFWKIMQ